MTDSVEIIRKDVKTVLESIRVGWLELVDGLPDMSGAERHQRRHDLDMLGQALAHLYEQLDQAAPPRS
jgi:hypothetical protein